MCPEKKLAFMKRSTFSPCEFVKISTKKISKLFQAHIMHFHRSCQYFLRVSGKWFSIYDELLTPLLQWFVSCLFNPSFKKHAVLPRPNIDKKEEKCKKKGRFPCKNREKKEFEFLYKGKTTKNISYIWFELLYMFRNLRNTVYRKKNVILAF